MNEKKGFIILVIIFILTTITLLTLTKDNKIVPLNHDINIDNISALEIVDLIKLNITNKDINAMYQQNIDGVINLSDTELKNLIKIQYILNDITL